MRPARGVVLVTVLLLLLAATLLVHGSVVLARAYRGGADAGWEASRVRRAAVGRLTSTLVGGGGASPWAPAGSEVEAMVEVVTLAPELELLAGGGRGRAAEWWVGNLAWVGDPATRAESAVAALRAGGAVRELGSGGVEGASAGGCAEATPMAARAALPDGPLHLGPLDLEALEERADPWEFDPGCEGGECTPLLAVSPGGGVVSGGRHSGVFVVRGDLVLAGNALLRGRLLVDGTLTVRDSAVVEGTADVVGSVTFMGAGGLRGDRCALAEVWRDGVGERVGRIPLEARPWPLWGPPP